MLVLPGPDAVLVLSDAGNLFWLNASVATAAGTTTRPVVFAGGSTLRKERRGQYQTHQHVPLRVGRLAHSPGVGKDFGRDVLSAARPCLYPFCRPESIDSLVRAEHHRTGTLVAPRPKIGIPCDQH